MQINKKNINKTCPESEIYNGLLSLDNKHILELGCGNAEITRALATEGCNRYITAMEVDEIQHNKNLMIDDLPNVDFILAGAEAIPAADEAFDVLFMFKSLHHVPVELMKQTMSELRRVLKPGGFAYISEPIFDGAFNDILKLFHDEEIVREAAFCAIKEAVNEGVFSLVEETFFNVYSHYKCFEEFEEKIINVTHTHHQLSDSVYKKVKQLFSQHMQDTGAHFLSPIRVDLLQRPLKNQ